MAKSIRRKTAKFELEPDGFSIHTFELSCQIKGKQYREIKEYLYSLNATEGEIVTFKECDGIHRCIAFSDYGLNITLVKNDSDHGYQGHYIRIFVSPRRLLDPDADYLGILQPKKKTVDQIAERMEELFKNTPIPADLNDYILTRVDLCTNIRCDKTKLFRELVRVIHKLPTLPKYERRLHKNVTKGMSDAQKNTTRKEDSKYNKHYFKVACDSMALVIYDKTYQMSAERLSEIAYEDYDYGVLRYECRLSRDPLRKIMKDEEIGTTGKLLKHLIVHSEDMMTEAFSRCFAEEDFCRLEEIERAVQQSSFRKETKDIMLELSSRMSRGKIMDKVFERMEKDGIAFDRKDILDRFAKLGINPIPLWKSFCAERLPSPVTLLRGISEGEIKVDYILIK